MQPLVRPFQDHAPPDVRHVAEAATVLEIREPELFRHAYRWRYERDLDERLLNEAFGDYLLRQRVPQWVRDYCRRVLNLAAVGQLDPRDFGVERPTMHRPRSSERQFASLATFAALVVYLLFFA
ncbi:MAG: hypothetical protein GWN84_14665 [Gammaproteobacteria bacterium]|nr:hypothetical protein [Gammaproteobacteria bacterium]NIR84042.1 hypothetical protein [Gammaproteobacteria bacterium]NIR89186.1 hypothetical protein [Gammaproteobacteria bacterium]NIU04988.1 hypothetical protein [Gammaproteobacteria bacterium]NIV52154.1 hypothetical protein [Gammaproteobacteria bacterium]